MWVHKLNLHFSYNIKILALKNYAKPIYCFMVCCILEKWWLDHPPSHIVVSQSAHPHWSLLWAPDTFIVSFL